MKGNVLEAVIGAAVLVIAAMFLYFAYITKDEDISDGYILVARFEDVGGLSVGSDIKLNGIKVGVIKNLAIDENYQARVELLLKNEIKIPDDSSASVTTDGLMGNKFIALSAGFSEQKFNEGDEIESTRSSLNLEKLIDKFLLSLSPQPKKE
ncbi:MAG: outer membrane lipid asymmetry maintenance protein MlaD [Holosporales bacterium]|jgi:phospholipid/cholesterol/gamma-HCH transport system substrate-binding protein|nr:outer membrane lipid asymmetry maintenance protein MlaD [Holosporales bacterium]